MMIVGIVQSYFADKKKAVVNILYSLITALRVFLIMMKLDTNLRLKRRSVLKNYRDRDS